ncbi:MAG: M56 family metallopeptidase [Planctomycetota bacterium]
MFALAPELVGIADWLVTFALHSTIVLAAAWSLSALLGRRGLWLQELLLRWSLWTALASSVLQVAVLQSPWSAGLLLPGPTAAAEAGEVLDLAAAFPGARLPADLLPGWWSQWSWQAIVATLAAAAALGGLLWLFVVHRRLGSLLAERSPETDPRVLATAAAVAAELGLRQSPHVSRSDRIATPIAFGLLRPEICLPARAAELTDPSLRAMLAHEVAHLRAADPAWMWAAAWLQALFPWQLLLVAVRARWARLVELRCDAIAARTVTPTAVARCLLDVAGWLRGRPTPLVALGMAARPSALRERVEAALRGDAFRPSPRGLSLSLGGAMLSALSLGAPGVATAPGTVGLELVAVPHAAPASPSPMAAALRAMADHVRQETAAVLAEAELLRSRAPATPTTPALAALQADLTRRLDELARMRVRLDALLARFDSRNR